MSIYCVSACVAMRILHVLMSTCRILIAHNVDFADMPVHMISSDFFFSGDTTASPPQDKTEEEVEEVEEEDEVGGYEECKGGEPPVATTADTPVAEDNADDKMEDDKMEDDTPVGGSADEDIPAAGGSADVGYSDDEEVSL